MILFSTHIKLVRKDAIIWRVDFPEMHVQGITIPASHEHFAIKKAAEYAKDRYQSYGVGKVSAVAAKDFNPIYDR